MNILLALILTTAVLSQGADVPLYRTAAPVIGKVEADGAGAKAGLQVGDRVVRLNGKDVATWDEFDMLVASKANRELDLVVERGGSSPGYRRCAPGDRGFRHGRPQGGPRDAPADSRCDAQSAGRQGRAEAA